MPPPLASLLFAIGIAGLFYLDRDSSARPSKALWLPVIWLAINGSRPVSAWLGMSPPPTIPGQLPQTSLLDQAVAGSLMLLAAIVLIRRGSDVAGLLKASWPILLYFSFALVSLSWSDFPAWGFKRWTRALGDVVMALIIVTDAHPAAALRRLYSRAGFILLPLSLLFIKYYPNLGTATDPFGWGGQRMNTGVTTDKNMLGVLTYVIALGAVWQVLSLLRDKEQPHFRRRLLAHGTLLAFGIDLLFTAHSATSGISFVLGAGLMLALARPLFQRGPAAVHVLVLAILLSGGVAGLLGAAADLATATGRSADLSGRTEIWKLLIPMCPNPVGGAGFETFWAGPRAGIVNTRMIVAGSETGAHESHNGYIEMYLNLGWIGVGLIALILGHGYRKAVGAFRHDPALGALLIAYVVTLAFYNITEAGFRMLDLSWFFLLLSVVASNHTISLGETASETAHELADPTAVVRESNIADLEPTWMNSWRPCGLETRSEKLDAHNS
jgi:exopolysaccharide production protein ExoQ